MAVKDYIEERAVEIAGYIVETKATVRQAAKKFGISKSTVHKDCVERLKMINPALAIEVRKVLDVNKQERHIRGGIATREKISPCSHAVNRRAGLNADHKISVFMEPGKLKYECLCYYPTCSG